MDVIAFVLFIGEVILGASAVALIALLIGGIFNLDISDNARRTLWGVFIGGIIVGGAIVFYFW